MEHIAACIDHTLLQPNASAEDIRVLCGEAKLYGFASVCVQPIWVRYAKDLLHNSPVQVCTVVGFPLGTSTPETKAFETRQAVDNGADEIDMVINRDFVHAPRLHAMVKKPAYDHLLRDMSAVRTATRKNTVLKVILETCDLTDEEIQIVCDIASSAGADFVKTSTGFGKGGATVEHVRLMKQSISPHMQVKASGGIKTYEDALAMIQAGATRIGTSSGVSIVTGSAGKNDY